MTPFETKRKILEVHLKKGSEERKKWDEWTSWYLGDDTGSKASTSGSLMGVDNDQAELKLDTNYPYAFVDTMIANVCPTNPMMTVNARSKDKEEAAKAREALINDTLHRDKTHAKAWDMSSFTALCGRAFSKTVWSYRHKRPVTRVVNPRNIFYDMSVDWEDSRYVIEAVPITKAEFDQRAADPEFAYDPEVVTKVKAGSMPTWMFDKNSGQSYMNDASRSVFEWVIVYEYYDLVDGTMCHMLEDADKPLFEGARPYRFLENVYTPMMFNKNLTDNGGLSDVKLIARIQERLNELDALELWFAHTSIPTTLMNDSLVENPEEAATSIANCTGPGDIARIKVKNEAPIDAVIGYTRSPGLTPSWDKMRERCIALIEFILGIPQYMRGGVGNSDIATEVALADTATRTRNGRRIKVIEDWIADISRKSLALWREYMPKAPTLTMRGRTEFDKVEVDRLSLAFPDELDPNDPSAADIVDDDWFFDYESVPYSPTENHKLVQVQKLQQFMEALMSSPAIDQVALMYKLTELLGIESVRKDPNQMQQEAQAQTPPGVPQPQGGPSGTSADTISTGALPEGVEQANQAILPPNHNTLASQPVA